MEKGHNVSFNEDIFLDCCQPALSANYKIDSEQKCLLWKNGQKMVLFFFFHDIQHNFQGHLFQLDGSSSLCRAYAGE